jgi:hypothetical protein
VRVSHWPDGSYPIYLNPTFEEIVELAAQSIDTLRIMEDGDHLAVASGYGNTHDSVQRAARKHWPRFFPIDHILVRVPGGWKWTNLHNTEHSSEFLTFEEGLKWCEPRTREFVREFVKLYS